MSACEHSAARIANLELGHPRPQNGPLQKNRKLIPNWPFLLPFAKCTTPPERSMIARRRCYFRGRVLKSRQFKSARNMPRSDDRKSKGPGLALLEYLLRLDREAQRNFG